MAMFGRHYHKISLNTSLQSGVCKVLEAIEFLQKTGVHSVFINFYDYPLEKAIGTMIRLILALQKHRECTHV